VADEFVLSKAKACQRGRWRFVGGDNEPWTVRLGSITTELKPTAFGHIGLFPEQLLHARWLGDTSFKGASILNLFAHSGLLSLQLALCGAEVTHVDSSASAVRWARKNAQLSGLKDAPIRWIVEDAMRLVRREIKRGRSYHGFVIDPPTFGRGPRNETWQIDRDLSTLLELLVELSPSDLRLVLITAHTAGLGGRRLAEMAKAAFGNRVQGRLESGESGLVDLTGRSLPCGSFTRWKHA
jgi:23S rRNA (cytosine1962-C5)-methyltransferase